MHSSLEHIPGEIMEHIAFFTATDILQPPLDLRSLLLTSRTIYGVLSPHSAPQLYARIFCCRFDVDPEQRALGTITTSHLTFELFRRYQLLRRVRRRDLTSSRYLATDLQTALRMTFEDRGLNDRQLCSDVAFHEFIMQVLRVYLKRVGSHDFMSREIIHMSLWLATLCWSPDYITSVPEVTRDEFTSLLRLHSTPNLRNGVDIVCHDIGTADASSYVVCPSTDVTRTVIEDSSFLGKRDQRFPQNSFAAIALICAFKDLDGLQVPPHLPENRLEALTTNRDGPTKEDYRRFAASRTTLLVEHRRQRAGAQIKSLTSVSPPLNLSTLEAKHTHALASSGDIVSSLSRWGVANTLSGVWEGMYMVSPFASSAPANTSDIGEIGDFICRVPLQSSFETYVCVSPHVALPSHLPGDGLSWTDDAMEQCRWFSHRLSPGRHYRYELVGGRGSQSSASAVPKYKSSEISDCILIGKTLDEHDDAWGGFTFCGRVHADGRIVIQRKPKLTREIELGTWIFEGYLLHGAVFVGQWRSCDIADPSALPGGSSGCGGTVARGIFSMMSVPESSGTTRT